MVPNVPIKSSTGKHQYEAVKNILVSLLMVLWIWVESIMGYKNTWIDGDAPKSIFIHCHAHVRLTSQSS